MNASKPLKRITLVNPPNHRYDRFELAPPLGLLGLAETALTTGWTPSILDLALPEYHELADDPVRFYNAVVEAILQSCPTIVGFTSMGVNSHVALLLAEQLKQRDPSITVILGGAHFSSIAREIQQHFEWVDSVIVGEADNAFRDYLSSWPMRRERREGETSSVRGPPPSITHPHSAYQVIHLDDYFAANERRVLNYESGRGCVFKCAFCYSPAHYQMARQVPIPTVVADWYALCARGARHLFVVDDNFTNNPRHAVALCDALAAHDIPVTWNGYATLPQLSATVIRALSRSKCIALYLGIDAVTPTQSSTFNKSFYRGDDDLSCVLSRLVDAGIDATCAFMVDLCAYDVLEMEQVFRTAAQCAAMGMSIRINVLTRMPGSALASRSPNSSYPSEARVRALLDCPEVVCVNPLVAAHPLLFPFHCTEVSESEWASRLRLVRVGQVLIQKYPAEFMSLSRSGHMLEPGLARLAQGLRSVDVVPKTLWRTHVAEYVEQT